MDIGIPFAIVVLGGGFMATFRANIGSFIDRMNKAKAPGFEISMSPKEQHLPSADDIPALSAVVPASVASGAPNNPPQLPPATPAQVAYEDETRNALQQIAPDQWELQVKYLVRALAIISLERNHEANYRIMFGSQLRALQGLNQRGGTAPLNDGRPLYDEAFNAEEQTKVPFDRWWVWLRDIGYIAVNEIPGAPAVASLTAIGRDFLMWMVGRGVAEDRAH